VLFESVTVSVVCNLGTVKSVSIIHQLFSVVYREGGFGVFKPPPEILKISVESSIA